MIADMALNEGIKIAFEYHGDTLTDSAESAYRLLAQTKNLYCYWQPSNVFDEKNNIASIKKILPWLSYIHVFHWKKVNERCSLDEGNDVWKRYFEAISKAKGDIWCSENVKRYHDRFTQPASSKANNLTDLKKAKDYLERMIEQNKDSETKENIE